VIPYGMPFSKNFFCQLRIPLHFIGYQKKGGFGMVFPQNTQRFFSDMGGRAIIKRNKGLFLLYGNFPVQRRIKDIADNPGSLNKIWLHNKRMIRKKAGIITALIPASC
jgi:hypothetical protein